MHKIPRWKVRHTVLSIICVTWIVTYIDRTAISLAMPYIAGDYHLSSFASGVVLGVFFAGYSISQIPGGLLADRYGVRGVATLSLVAWSVLTAITGAVTSVTQMVFSRLLFGLTEGLYPGCAFKTIAVWFPKAERATANAVMFAFGTIGSAVAPLVVVPVMSYWGWRPMFYCLLAPGIVMSILFWIYVPDRPSESSRVSPAEVLEIEGNDDAGESSGLDVKARLAAMLKQRNVLKYFLVLFAFDTAYWGYSTWLPMYLVKARGFSMLQMGAATSLPYLVGVAGCIAGGWVSDKYFSHSRRRLIAVTQLVPAVLLLLIFAAKTATSVVIYQSLAEFFLEAFFAAFWALPMNTVSKSLMGITAGFINMAGQIAALIAPIVIGYLVGSSGNNYASTFKFVTFALLISYAILITIPAKLETAQE